MGVRIEAHAEPLPGYKLIERLGGGGFGEVWKAEAPGGLLKAIKFVYGDLQGAAGEDDGSRAEQELKALSRVKTVHHPYILSLERYDIIDGQLMIVMELADRTLWDRFKECRGQGLPGIPRAELIEYMRETAEALDLMNQQYQLQHLDIKPQNLFLTFNHVKVADFGLVKDLGTMAAATVTGGVTPVYAAPETFDGWLSRFSDQYSLAIVYQELLTGQRPFAGQTMRQLVMQHLQGEPDLSMLPFSDRAAVSRALAKNPDDRFPTCLALVEALREAAPKPTQQPGSDGTAESAALIDTNESFPTPLSAPEFAEDVTRNDLGNLRAERTPKPEPTPVSRPNVLPPRPARPAGLDGPSSDLDYTEELVDPESLNQTCLRRRRASNEALNDALNGLLEDSTQRGIVQPALVVGLGKLGIDTLLALRKQLSQEFGHPDALPHIRLLAMDIDPDALQGSSQGEGRSGLRSHEVVLARLHRAAHYLAARDRDGRLPTDSWLNPKLLYRIPKQTNTAGLRALGRLAFIDNYRHIARRLEAELCACAAQDTLHEMVQQTDLGIRSVVPRVYIVAGLGGNTGSGMFLDTAYVVRQLLRKHGFGRAEIVALFYVPDASKSGTASTGRTMAQMRTYAALAELNHFGSGRTVFNAAYDVLDPHNAKVISEAGSPFQRCYFLTLPPQPVTVEADAVPETVALAGQFLYRDLATALGKTLDSARGGHGECAADGHTSLTMQTLGLHRILWPRKRLLEQAALRLSRRVVERWMVKDASPLAKDIERWANEQWEAFGMRPEALIGRHLDACEKALQQPPERMLQGVLSPLAKLLKPPAGAKPGTPSPPISITPVVGALASLEKILGVPDECRDSNLMTSEPSLFERTLAEVATTIADACDQKLSELIVQLLEEPRFRLAGAEEGLRQFCIVAEQSLRSQESLAKELHEHAAVAYQRIQAAVEVKDGDGQATTLWKFGRKTPTKQSLSGADLLELIRHYAKTRFQSLVLGHLQRLYVSLRGHFSDQVREIGFCRQRLRELQGLLEDRPTASLTAVSSFEKLLLPPKCAKVEDAVDRLATATEADLLNFDKSLQVLIRQQYRALLTVCMGPASLVRNLAPQMVQEAERFLAPRFQGASVAEMWLSRSKDDDEICTELADAFDEAVPELRQQSNRAELAVAAFPASPTGVRLQELARLALPEVKIVASHQHQDEIVFYREQQVSLDELDQFGPAAQEAYRLRNAADPSSLHSREDMALGQPLAKAQ